MSRETKARVLLELAGEHQGGDAKGNPECTSPQGQGASPGTMPTGLRVPGENRTQDFASGRDTPPPSAGPSLGVWLLNVHS